MDEPSAQPRDDPETRVVHEPERSRFQVTLGGGTAELRYQRLGKTLVLVHTGVPPELEGRGIGGALVRAAFDYVRGHGMVVVPLCPSCAPTSSATRSTWSSSTPSTAEAGWPEPPPGASDAPRPGRCSLTPWERRWYEAGIASALVPP